MLRSASQSVCGEMWEAKLVRACPPHREAAVEAAAALGMKGAISEVLECRWHTRTSVVGEVPVGVNRSAGAVLEAIGGLAFRTQRDSAHRADAAEVLPKVPWPVNSVTTTARATRAG